MPNTYTPCPCNASGRTCGAPLEVILAAQVPEPGPKSAEVICPVCGQRVIVIMEWHQVWTPTIRRAMPMTGTEAAT